VGALGEGLGGWFFVGGDCLFFGGGVWSGVQHNSWGGNWWDGRATMIGLRGGGGGVVNY